MHREANQLTYRTHGRTWMRWGRFAHENQTMTDVTTLCSKNVALFRQNTKLLQLKDHRTIFCGQRHEILFTEKYILRTLSQEGKHKHRSYVHIHIYPGGKPGID